MHIYTDTAVHESNNLFKTSLIIFTDIFCPSFSICNCLDMKFIFTLHSWKRWWDLFWQGGCNSNFLTDPVSLDLLPSSPVHSLETDTELCSHLFAFSYKQLLHAKHKIRHTHIHTQSRSPWCVTLSSAGISVSLCLCVFLCLRILRLCCVLLCPLLCPHGPRAWQVIRLALVT